MKVAVVRLTCADLIQLIRDAAMGPLRKFKNSDCLKRYMKCTEEEEHNISNGETGDSETAPHRHHHHKETESEIVGLLRVTKVSEFFSHDNEFN